MKEVSPEELLDLLRIEYFEKSGRVSFCCCFHDDTNPSAGFYKDTGLAHCFSCEYTLDVIQFYAKFHEISRSAAIRDLEKQFGPLVERKVYLNKNLMHLIRARGEKTIASLKGKIPREVHAKTAETLDRILVAYERKQIDESLLQEAIDKWLTKTKGLTTL